MTTQNAFSTPHLRLADTPELLVEVRHLFSEYAESLGVDLCFQDIETELTIAQGG